MRLNHEIEVFYFDGRVEPGSCWAKGIWSDDEDAPAGWYFWYCQPGCLPDSEPIGPYQTRSDAIAAADADPGHDT
jgi:hypothetical protein